MFTYSIGEVVWSKVDDLPWWPAVVTNICKDSSSEEFYVSLINCNYQTKLSIKRVEGYYLNFDKYYSNNDAKLTKACETANNIKLKGLNYFDTNKVWKNEINNAKIKSVYKSENSIEYSVDFNVENRYNFDNNDVKNFQKFNFENHATKTDQNNNSLPDKNLDLQDKKMLKNSTNKENIDQKEQNFVQDLEVRIRNLMVQFSKAIAANNSMSQNLVLHEIFRIVSNLENVEIKTDVLVNSKICKYLQSFYVLQYNHKKKIPENLNKILPLQRNQINLTKEKLINRFMLFDEGNFDGDKELGDILIKEQGKNILESKENKKTNKINYVLDNFDVKIKFEDEMTQENDTIDLISSVSENEDDYLNKNSSLPQEHQKENTLKFNEEIIPKDGSRKMNLETQKCPILPVLKNITQEKQNLSTEELKNDTKAQNELPSKYALPNYPQNMHAKNKVPETSNQYVNKQYGIINNYNENVLVLQQFETPALDIENNSQKHNSSGGIQSTKPMTQEMLNDQQLLNSLKKEDQNCDSSTNSQNTLRVEQKNDFRIKYEGTELPKKRKKTCRKIYTAFIEEFKLEKASARLVTLNIEYRIHCLINYEDEKYNLTIKKQLRHVKHSKDCATEIKNILAMSISHFQKYLTDRSIY